MADDQPDTGSQEFWDDRYRAHDKVWSGHVNYFVEREVVDLDPGTALDLGCGEGGDAIWLARHGWQVTAVDLSSVALKKARAEAERVGVAERISFEHHDLRETFPTGPFDLVSAQFIHPPAGDLAGVLAQAAHAVAPGGTILVTNHRGYPSFMTEPAHDIHFPDEDELIAGITGGSGAWDLIGSGEVVREVTSPDGATGTHTDFVVHLRRSS